MPSLLIEIVGPDGAGHQQFSFNRSPVRIGRSPLNDCPLPFPTVSHCHAVVHFRGGAGEFVDLGSTNGSQVEGAPVMRNVAYSLGARATVVVGTVSLRLTIRDESVRGTRQSYAFDRNALLASAGLSATDVASTGGEVAPDSARHSQQPQGAHAEQLAGAYRAYRTACSQLFEAVRQQHATTAPEGRRRLYQELIEHYPDLIQERGFLQLFGQAPGSLSLPPPPTAPAPAGREARMEALLERFVRAFLELRRGREQLLVQLGLGEMEQDAELRDLSRDPERLLTYLLDPARGQQPLDSLSRAYADIMLHEVAFLSAVTAGARDLVNHFEPDAIRVLARRPFGWIARTFGRDSRFSVLQRRFRDLQEETALVSVLFGQAFRRSYHAVFGARQSGADRSVRLNS